MPQSTPSTGRHTIIKIATQYLLVTNYYLSESSDPDHTKSIDKKNKHYQIEDLILSAYENDI